MNREPSKECLVFVSRKTSDVQIGHTIRDRLKKYSGNLHFFDASNIPPGDGWRETLRHELQRANLLLLLLTRPARHDFDWPLYEAGLFESLDVAEKRRTICIYADAGERSQARQRKKMGVPSQLGDKQAVPAQPGRVLDLLQRLFGDKDFTNTVDPLNPNLGEEDLLPIAEEICAKVNGVEGDQLLRYEYVNTYVQLLLPPNVEGLDPAVEIESDKGSLRRLFGLGLNPPGGLRWSWDDLRKCLASDSDPGGFNRRWAKQLDCALQAMRRGHEVEQLTGRFLGADGRLYRPEIELYRLYENQRLHVDVTFSEQVQDSWMGTARAPVALAANLALASRIRHEVLEPYLRKVPRWRLDSAKQQGCSELTRLVQDIEHDGYFIDQMTNSQLQEAFDQEDMDELGNIHHEYATEIRPLFEQALSDGNLDELREALERWKLNNQAFLDLGLRRYAGMLGLKESPGPRRLSVSA